MTLLDILSWVFLAGGSFFVFIGGIGLLRLPDFYTRIHAAGITDTLGAGLILVGLILQAVEQAIETGGIQTWLIAVKLALIMLFILLTSPTSGHALAKAAFLRGLEPYVKKEKDA